jgi:hypothetical protein
MTRDLLGFAALVAVWAAFVWFSEFRTARTVVLLSLATVGVVAADALPPPWPVVVVAAVAAALLAVHLRFNQWISAHSPEELEFRSRFVAINDRLQLAYRDYEASGDPTNFREALETAHRDLTSLSAPGSGWEDIQRAVLELLDDRVKIHDAHRELDPKTRMQFRSERAALQENFRATVHRTARFWR